MLGLALREALFLCPSFAPEPPDFEALDLRADSFFASHLWSLPEKRICDETVAKALLSVPDPRNSSNLSYERMFCVPA